MGQSIDKRQLLWGIVAGLITAGLMTLSYFVGENRGKGEEDEVLGEVEQQEIEDREVYIAVRTGCSGYESGTTREGHKEVKKYCVAYENGKNAFDMMKKLAVEDTEFTFDYEESELGAFITSINNYHPDIASKFWAFLVNGETSMVGVSGYEVNDGDELGFRIEESEF